MKWRLDAIRFILGPRPGARPLGTPANALKFITAAGMFLLCVAGQSDAQSKVGTTAGAFLGIEPSARSAGMGNAGVALAQGIESVYFNPGTLGALRRKTAQFTHSLWYADILYNYAAAALPISGHGTLFASLTALGSGEIDVRTVDRPLGTGERYTVSNVALSLGYGRALSERFSAGIQVNYVRERIWHTSQDFLTMSLGTVYKLTSNGLTLGSSLSNLGTEGKFEGRDLAIQYDATSDVYGDNGALPAYQLTNSFPVPLLFLVGLSYPAYQDERSRILVSLDALHPNNNSESVNLGGEWAFREMLFLRAGYQTLFQEDSELGPTFGFGLRGGLEEHVFRFDYGWGSHDHLDGTHRMTLIFEL